MNLNQVWARYFTRISQIERLLFTRHLGVMLKAGIPISEAMGISQAQSGGGMGRIAGEIQKSIDNGQSLHASLAEYPAVFDQFYVSLVKIGETSGNLDSNLLYLGAHLNKEYSTQQKVRSALLYPMVVLAATVAIGGFIAFFILPQLLVFFEAFEIELPLATRILLFIAQAAVNWGWLILLSLPVLVVGVVLARQLPAVKYIIDAASIRLPIFGQLVRDYQLSRFTRNAGLLLKSGVPILLTLEITRDAMDNLEYARAVDRVVEQVKLGRFVGESIAEASVRLFPTMVGRMLGVGDKTGKLDEILLYLGDFYDEEIDTITKNMSTLLEPVLLIFIGLAVGFVALAIISPIYELTGSIGQ